MIKLERGVITQASKELGVTRPTIYRGIYKKRHDILQKLYELQTKADKEQMIAKKIYKKMEAG